MTQPDKLERSHHVTLADGRPAWTRAGDSIRQSDVDARKAWGLREVGRLRAMDYGRPGGLLPFRPSRVPRLVADALRSLTRGGRA